VLHVRCASLVSHEALSPAPSPERAALAALRHVLASDAIKNSWSVENVGTCDADDLTPARVLPMTESAAGGSASAGDETAFYVSGILQKDEALTAQFLKSVPAAQPPFAAQSGDGGAWTGLSYSKPIWLFFGRNSTAAPLVGRVEHTDSVTHSGTWHLQLRYETVESVRVPSMFYLVSRKHAQNRVLAHIIMC
jgi:hypothetical protein